MQAAWLQREGPGLVLNSMHIQQIPDGAFDHFEFVTYLRLEDNALTEIPSLAFYGLSGIVSLNLNMNNISRIYADAFVGLYSLADLDLGGKHTNSIHSELKETIYCSLLKMRVRFYERKHEEHSFPSRIF